MSETPSKRRRLGREAYTPNVDPMDLQHYDAGSWSYHFCLTDWLDGWYREEEAYNAKLHSGKECTCPHQNVVTCKYCLDSKCTKEGTIIRLKTGDLPRLKLKI